MTDSKTKHDESTVKPELTGQRAAKAEKIQAARAEKQAAKAAKLQAGRGGDAGRSEKLAEKADKRVAARAEKQAEKAKKVEAARAEKQAAKASKVDGDQKQSMRAEKQAAKADQRLAARAEKQQAAKAEKPQAEAGVERRQLKNPHIGQNAAYGRGVASLAQDKWTIIGLAICRVSMARAPESGRGAQKLVVESLLAERQLIPQRMPAWDPDEHVKPQFDSEFKAGDGILGRFIGNSSESRWPSVLP